MADDNVTHVDFGKAERESVRCFARLMGIVEEHQRRIAENPGPYLDALAMDACDLVMLIERAIEASRPQRGLEPFRTNVRYEPVRTVTVVESEYLALRQCVSLLQEGVKHFRVRSEARRAELLAGKQET